MHLPRFLATTLLALSITTTAHPITRDDLVLPFGITMICAAATIYLYDAYYMPCLMLPDCDYCLKRKSAERFMLHWGLIYTDLGLYKLRRNRQND